ncbi:MAG: tRNA (N6-isopentenyl adenosine(37)-C2)-methylthiotransferase MiaB [candidate division WOR-3 bacterium]|nr:tRNA (N6-isopentenyl adenosine(37)-C2)-methylthiotransferase MiaB [candidate division WOR-3 bacterium]
MSELKFYIKVYGCQMNQYDAGVIRRIMEESNFIEVSDVKEADIILVLTCSVRSHAEIRALGQLNFWRRLKYEKPGLIIGVLGCMAQNLKDLLIEKFNVDLVVGSDQYRFLPKLINEYYKTKLPQVATEFTMENYEHIIPKTNNASVVGYISIMRGCNNYCSYCIVPYVRGRERSKSLSQIVTEAESLIRHGVKEITLIGQNVLAWHDNNADFLTLLKEIDQLDGYYRLRFLTSHPKDLTVKHWETFSQLKKFCPYIHLPLQSGSNRILALMNRGYTKEEYLEKVMQGRQIIPDLVFTTDVMVGFPTETDDDYKETLDLLGKIKFDFAYMFKYSERPYTKAQKITPKVDAKIAQERLIRLIEYQNKITKERINSYLNKECEILVEFYTYPYSKGRTKDNKMVIIKDKLKIGEIYRCRITNIKGWTLIGEIIDKSNCNVQNKVYYIENLKEGL